MYVCTKEWFLKSNEPLFFSLTSLGINIKGNFYTLGIYNYQVELLQRVSWFRIP